MSVHVTVDPRGGRKAKLFIKTSYSDKFVLERVQEKKRLGGHKREQEGE